MFVLQMNNTILEERTLKRNINSSKEECINFVRTSSDTFSCILKIFDNEIQKPESNFYY